MRGEGGPALGLGLLLLLHGTVLAVWSASAIAGLLLGSGLALLVLAGALELRARRAAGGADHFARTRPVGDASMPTVIVAVGIGLAAVGAAIGLWLVLTGAGVAVLGAAAAARETLATRRAVRR
jgi:hypothetical protein